MTFPLFRLAAASIAGLACLGALTGCDKANRGDAVAPPASVVMPTTPSDTGASSAMGSASGAAPSSLSTTSGTTPPAPGGTVSTISGGDATATAGSGGAPSVPTLAASAPEPITAGVPPQPPASYPGPAVIQPTAPNSADNQPPSVSPGSVR